MSEHFPKGQEPDFPVRILRIQLLSLMSDCDGERENVFCFITAIKPAIQPGLLKKAQISPNSREFTRKLLGDCFKLVGRRFTELLTASVWTPTLLAPIVMIWCYAATPLMVRSPLMDPGT